MRILTKFDIRNGNIVKGINYEGVEEIGYSKEIYEKVCQYISTELKSHFEIILNDVTASLYSIKSGEKDIRNILDNKIYSLPHICSGGINNFEEIKNKLSYGCDRVMINTGLYEDIEFINKTINLYGSQIFIASIETRYVDGDYYTYKCYGRENTGIRLCDWIKFLKSKGVVEILVSSIDKDGTLTCYDKDLLKYIKNTIDISGISFLYSGGVKNTHQIDEIKKKYLFITGVCISSLFYKSIKKKIYFLRYLEGNNFSVMKYYEKFKVCIIVDNVKEIPNGGLLCVNGHYNTYNIVGYLINNNDFELLKYRLLNKQINYIGICAGLQLLTSVIKDEFSNLKIEGLGIIKHSNIKKYEQPKIGFYNGKFHCHSYYLVDENDSEIFHYKKENIDAYQFHPENSIR